MNLKMSNVFVIVLSILVFECRSTSGAKRKRMPKTCYWLNKVPVHQRFNLNRRQLMQKMTAFKGTWYTVARTTEMFGENTYESPSTQFKGTWYTVARTTEMFGENTYESPSTQITKHEDDTYSYSLTGMKGDKCIPVETGSLEPTNRTGLIQLIPPGGSLNNYVTMIVSFTDYKNMAMVYYCFKHKHRRKHQCAPNGIHVEILSRSENPDPDLVKNYIKRAQRRLCVSSKRLVPTKPGLCKIPDLLAAAKKKEIDVSQENDGSKEDKCAVHNIPVQEDFTLQQMEGLWYEIARTRFTFNKLESVVTRHVYDPIEDVINSLYVGGNYSEEATGDSVCMNAALSGMSRTNPEATEAADMQGRIGGEKSGYFWAPMKVLYADDKYLMFYACYYVGPDGHCIQGQMEVTLVGRSREISDEARDEIYEHLSDICVDKSAMQETKFLVNCTDLVSEDLVQIERTPCYLKNIQPAVDYDFTMLEGTWYLFASISYSKDKLSGVVIEKQVYGNEDPIRSRIFARDLDNASICTDYTSTAREMCLGDGSHIITPPVGNVGNFYFSKILNITDDFFIEYTCTKRNLDDSCDHSGAELHVYTRHVPFPTQDHADNNNNGEADYGADYGADYPDGADDDEMDDVENENDVDNEEEENYEAWINTLQQDILDMIPPLARNVCLNPNDLKHETAWCSPPNNSLNYKEANCDIDLAYNIMGDYDDFNPTDVHGYWYEVARSHGISFLGNTGRLSAYFTSASNTADTLQILYTGLSQIGEGTICSDIQSTTLMTRCPAEPVADYLALFNETANQTSYIPYKIVYAERDSFMLTLVCEFVDATGDCAEGLAFTRVWARNMSVSREEIAEVLVYGEWVCLDNSLDDNVFFSDEDYSCMEGLEYYVTENVEITPEEIEESEDMEEDLEQQQDEPEDIVKLSDLDWELEISDEDFYS